MANKKKTTALASTTEIVKPEGKTILDKNSGRQVINMSLLEPQVRDKVVELTNSLRQAFTEVRTGVLKIGKDLSELEMILKPRGLWLPYLNSFPNFKQAQAYRYINGYTVAQKHFPQAVLDVILNTGMDMIGTKDRPFGKYQEIVKQLPPPKDADAGKALAWCNQVEMKYRESRKRENRTVSVENLQKDAFLAVTKKYHQVPEKKQLQWIRNLMGYILGSLGMKQNETIVPQDPPANFLRKAKGETEEGEQQEPGE